MVEGSYRPYLALQFPFFNLLLAARGTSIRTQCLCKSWGEGELKVCIGILSYFSIV